MTSSSSSNKASRGSYPSQVNKSSRSLPTSLSGQSRPATQRPKPAKSESDLHPKQPHKSSSKRPSQASSASAPSKPAPTRPPKSSAAEPRSPTGRANGTEHSSPPLDRYARSGILSTPLYTICPVMLNEAATRARAQAMIEWFEDEMELYGDERPAEDTRGGRQ